MVGRGHTKETVGLLNINSIHLYTLFDGRSWSYQRNRGVVKCKLYTFGVGRGHTKETVGLLNINSIHLYTLFDGRSWSYQRNRGVVKYKLYTFIHPLR